MDQRYGLSGGLLNNLTWSDDGRTLLEAGFWEIKDNNLIPVQVDMRTSQIDITLITRVTCTGSSGMGSCISFKAVPTVLIRALRMSGL